MFNQSPTNTMCKLFVRLFLVMFLLSIFIRTTDGIPVYYVYDGNTVILELDGNGAEKARNVYGRNLIARESDGEKAIYRYNGHGDVITIMGTDGTAISSYEYEHAIIGTSDENLVKSRVSELVPFLFCQRASTIHL